MIQSRPSFVQILQKNYVAQLVLRTLERRICTTNKRDLLVTEFENVLYQQTHIKVLVDWHCWQNIRGVSFIHIHVSHAHKVKNKTDRNKHKEEILMFKTSDHYFNTQIIARQAVIQSYKENVKEFPLFYHLSLSTIIYSY